MSKDFNIVCMSCRTYRHLGQWMGGKWSLGYGTKDNETGRHSLFDFIEKHLYGGDDEGTCCCAAINLVIVSTDNLRSDLKEDPYKPNEEDPSAGTTSKVPPNPTDPNYRAGECSPDPVGVSEHE